MCLEQYSEIVYKMYPDGLIKDLGTAVDIISETEACQWLSDAYLVQHQLLLQGSKCI